MRQGERQKGITLSALLHLLFLILMVFGLPSFLLPSLPPEPAAITVELLPISDVSNVKPSEQAPDVKPEEKPEEKPDPKKPTPPVKTAEETPPPPPEKPDEKAKEKPKEKPPEPKKDEKKNKAKEEDLEAVLKAVRETAQKEKTDKNKKDSASPTKSLSDQYNPSLPLSISEKDAIRSQIAKCWNVPAGARNAHELIVVLQIQLEKDGSVIKVALANESKARYSRDTFFRAAADSAMRAIRQCSPIKNLSPEKYQTWRDMELTFNPKEMLF